MNRVCVLWGFGDYASTDGANILARWQFLDAVADHVPEALRSLHTFTDAHPRWTHLRDVWGRQWGLSDPWMTHIADETLTRWAKHPVTMYRWAKPGVSVPDAWPPAPTWNPTIEPEVHYRARIERYIRQTVKLAREGGLVQTANTTMQVHDDPARLLIALARYKVGGVALTQLMADLDIPEESTLRKGMREAARMIGFTWTDQRGRPKKTGNDPI